MGKIEEELLWQQSGGTLGTVSSLIFLLLGSVEQS